MTSDVLFDPKPSGILTPDSSLADHHHFADAWGATSHLMHQCGRGLGCPSHGRIRMSPLGGSPLPSSSVIAMHRLPRAALNSVQNPNNNFHILFDGFEHPHMNVTLEGKAPFHKDHDGSFINVPNIKPEPIKSQLMKDIDFALASGGEKNALSFAHGRGAHVGRSFNTCPDC